MTHALRITAASAIVTVTLMATVYAHHSGTMFDDKRQITVEGVVKEFQYTNPHSWLLVDVENPDGTVTTWGFEAEGPSTLMQAKIRRSDFAPGVKITITGFPMRDGRPAAAWTKAVRESDGVEFYPRGRSVQAPQ
jgi:hypothetical protein